MINSTTVSNAGVPTAIGRMQLGHIYIYASALSNTVGAMGGYVIPSLAPQKSSSLPNCNGGRTCIPRRQTAPSFAKPTRCRSRLTKFTSTIRPISRGLRKGIK